MHINLQLLTALAVFLHLGTTLAGQFLKDKTDQKKIAAIDSKTDQVLSVVTAIAPALPTVAPKTVAQVAGDLAAVAQSLSQALAPATVTATGGTQNAG
jgi:hypothetical protein